MESRLVWNFQYSQGGPCVPDPPVYLLSAGITGLCHQTWILMILEMETKVSCRLGKHPTIYSYSPNSANP